MVKTQHGALRFGSWSAENRAKLTIEEVSQLDREEPVIGGPHDDDPLRPERIALYASRVARGLNIWSGLPTTEAKALVKQMRVWRNMQKKKKPRKAS